MRRTIAALLAIVACLLQGLIAFGSLKPRRGPWTIPGEA